MCWFSSRVSLAYGRYSLHLVHATLDLLINLLGSVCFCAFGLKVILKTAGKERHTVMYAPAC